MNEFKEFISPIKKILVANRSEIAIRVMRAAAELNIRTVAIYSYEDRYSTHRFKADEAYQIGEKDEAIKPYLDIEGIIKLAKRENVDAIHPGYGFLSENIKFVKRCEEEGINFIGPKSYAMEKLGDKIKSKEIAKLCKVPIIENSNKDLINAEVGLEEAKRIGFPVMIKASAGGGGRGMRVVFNENEFEKSFEDARNESINAFGSDVLYLEKYIKNPKHIEVQIIGDLYGNIYHLYERDCSLQRRFQKVIEIAPAPNLSEETKQKLYDYALKITKSVNYTSLGTVEFLVENNGNIYFIEVNPRIQVEHTITEEITLIDLVRTQILLAQGYNLQGDLLKLTSQESIICNGFAIQCRITTEDPEAGFKPDTGRILEYRNATGFGIRLDEGSVFSGAIVSPFFDSLLVKVIAKGRHLNGACNRMHRALREFRIRGVKTNIGFLQNIVLNEDFLNGNIYVKFIDEHPELLKSKITFDRATKTLKYLSNTIVNGYPYIDETKLKNDLIFKEPKIPSFLEGEYPKGTKDKLNELGRDGFIKWLKNENKIHYTDTTFRDAHQSLLATRFRTYDLLNISESYAKNFPQVFSIEMWGGATFDVCMRFLYESPWERLINIRKAIPNILLQMLIRGSNAVGYKSYPDNLIERFIELSAENGMDIFRIFDAFNWIESMKVSIKTVVNNTKSIAEGSICYTGNIIDKNSNKYTLEYYINLAKELQDLGIHILGIKDMAGLLTPYAAQKLIEELKKHIKIPIHLHTHDTSSVQSATYLKAIESNVDIIDVAISSMSGLTSQPNFNSIVKMMENNKRENKINLEKLNEVSDYFETVREYYYPFESELKAGTAQVYDHEIPGGQYSNLKDQARSLGLDDKIDLIKKNYAIANKILGNIVKVTPTSKVVGDLSLFMTSNNFTENDILDESKNISFPESLKSMLKGELGQPLGGFPKELQKIVLKDEKPFTNLPNNHLEKIDFKKGFIEFQKVFNNRLTELDFISYLLYPKVFEDYFTHFNQYGNLSYLSTPAFFYGLTSEDEINVNLQRGKDLQIRLIYKTKPDQFGFRNVVFFLNGKQRQISVKDNKFVTKVAINKKIDITNLNEIGSPLQGRLTKIFVKKGDVIKKNIPLFTIEAMKMETTITSAKEGKVSNIILKSGTRVEQNDLILILE